MVAAFAVDKKSVPVRLGWFSEKDEAKEVLLEIFDSVNRDEAFFCVPQQFESRAYHRS